MPIGQRIEIGKTSAQLLKMRHSSENQVPEGGFVIEARAS